MNNMGKPTGFIDYPRIETPSIPADQRVGNSEWFHTDLDCNARREQAGRCMNCGVPFCQAGITMGRKLIGCPLRNLIPEWNDQLWNENLPMALERLLRTNCFPEFTGYVCPAPCEAACSAGKVGAPVTINDNERYIIEEAFAEGLMRPNPPKGRSGLTIAVVGSGPAGLTVANLLNQRGHEVVIYERNRTPGGLLVYGIPAMKLPKSVVARRVKLMEAEGITFKCGVNIGVDVTIDQISENFDAVVLAIGSQKPREVPFEGKASGVCFALDYLSAVAADHLGEADLPAQFNASGKVIAVVGAGDSANDCIATAIRQGAKDVIQLIRRPATDYGPMTDYAHEEANALFDHDIRRFQTTVASVQADESGRLVQLTLDTPEGNVSVAADMLVIASGFSGPETYATEQVDLAACKNVFRAGDMSIGASLVVRAMADARKVARDVDARLMGYSGII